MADNVTITPGRGLKIATDDIGGVQHQRVKVSIGGDGVAEDLAFGQKAKAASLPVTIADNDDIHGKLGATNEAAPVSDTAAAGLNGRLQRIAQNLTSFLGAKVTVVTALGEGGSGVIGWLSQVWDKLNDQQARIGAINEAAPAGDTADAGLNGRLQRIAQNLTTLFGAKVTAVTALGAGGSGVIGWLSAIWDKLSGTLAVNQVTAAYDVKVTVTRPADTNAYSSGDVVGGVISFPNLGPSGSAIMITRSELEIDVTAIPVGMTSYRLHLYNVTPPSALADNAAWDLPVGDRNAYLGYVDLGSPTKLGSILYVDMDLTKQVKLAGTGAWAYLVTNGGYTPAANSEVYKPSLHAQAV